MKSLGKKLCLRILPEQKELNVALESVIDTTLVTCAKEGYKIPLAKNRERPDEREKYVVHASQIGYCALQIFYGLLEIEKHQELDPKKLRIFDNGDAVHQRIQGYFIEAVKRNVGGITAFEENHAIRVPELSLVGELDIMVQFFPSWIVVEIKSMKEEYFAKLKDAEEKWKNQLHCYMKATNVKNGVALVEGKNTQLIKTFRVPWDDKRWAKITSMINEINTSILTGNLPSHNKSDCFFCPYKNTYCPGYGKKPPANLQETIEHVRDIRSEKGIS